MGNGIVAIRSQIYAMIEADSRILANVSAQLQSPDPRSAGYQWLLERVAHTLHSHIDELREHVRRLGGSPPQARSAEARPVSLARCLRDLYTAFSLAHAHALMLETDARALNYSSSAALATRQGEEIAALLNAIRESLPAAVKEEIARAEIPT